MTDEEPKDVNAVQALDNFLIEKNIELTIEEEDHKKWLVAREGAQIAKVRLPRHLETMQPEQAEHAMSVLCAELKQKIIRGKGIIIATN